MNVDWGEEIAAFFDECAQTGGNENFELLEMSPIASKVPPEIDEKGYAMMARSVIRARCRHCDGEIKADGIFPGPSAMKGQWLDVVFAMISDIRMAAYKCRHGLEATY